MISGTYDVTLKTPMGVKKGQLILQDENGTLTGAMRVMGKENPFTPGICSGDRFSFSGALKTAVGRVAYDCDGTVTGGELTGVVKTKKGDLALAGKRTA